TERCLARHGPACRREMPQCQHTQNGNEEERNRERSVKPDQRRIRRKHDDSRRQRDQNQKSAFLPGPELDGRRELGGAIEQPCLRFVETGVATRQSRCKRPNRAKFSRGSTRRSPDIRPPCPVRAL